MKIKEILRTLVVHTYIHNIYTGIPRTLKTRRVGRIEFPLNFYATCIHFKRK